MKDIISDVMKKKERNRKKNKLHKEMEEKMNV